MQKIYLGTNTKMTKTVADTTTFLKQLGELTQDVDKNLLELFVIPSFTALQSARSVSNKYGIKLGAQNMFWQDRGAFTGEISPEMLKELDIDIVELGHSERRHIFGETDELINHKVISALNHNFTTLLCVGETLRQKETGTANEVLRIQLKQDLYNVQNKDVDKLWLAYEPVWAIGESGLPATAEYAEAKHKIIKDTLLEIFGSEGKNITVFYGGSVSQNNALDYIKRKYVDGLFIGRSAWNADDFYEIIKIVLKEKGN